MPSHRILIVEDHREVSRLLRSALETLENDLEVIEVPSGEEAILYSAQKKIDLLVSDYRLPGMTGVELMRKVQIKHPEAKIILVTGQPDPRIRKEIAEAGANAFFIKPIPMADFLDAVERSLELIGPILPLEPITTEEPGIQRSLPDLLAGLRRDLAATAVLLMNDTGRIEARAGDIPEWDNEPALISSLLSIYNASRTVTGLLGQENPSTRHLFEGGKVDLVFRPVGLTHAMLVIGVAGQNLAMKSEQVISTAIKEIEQVIGEFAQMVSGMQALPDTQEEEIGQINEMAPFFKGAKKKLKPDELNDFWNKAADTHQADSRPDKLSYEQARQLGLAPEDES